jgi:hypothetical protein
MIMKSNRDLFDDIWDSAWARLSEQEQNQKVNVTARMNDRIAQQMRKGKKRKDRSASRQNGGSRASQPRNGKSPGYDSRSDKNSADYDSRLDENSADYDSRLNENSADYDSRLDKKSRDYNPRLDKKSQYYEPRFNKYIKGSPDYNPWLDERSPQFQLGEFIEARLQDEDEIERERNAQDIELDMEAMASM